MNGLVRHNNKFSTEYSSDQMIHRNITMLSSIGAIACSSGRIMNSSIRLELNGNSLLCEVPVIMHPFPWHWYYDA